MIDIVIPVYKKEPDADEITAIKQAFKILKQHPITFVHPQGLDTAAYRGFGEAAFKGFNNAYFASIYGYNQLMLSVDFYEAFSKKYILIYQTDAFVFKDELAYWCAKDYDYIGAPWIRSREEAPLVKKIWDNTACFVKKLLNYQNNGEVQKNKLLLYNQVGNGGFSLRKREKFIEVLKKLPQQVAIYLKPANQSAFYAEDVFFSIEPKRNNIEFKKPYYQEACLFAIENKVPKALAFNKQILPMGCHRWNKENRALWEPFIKNETEGI